MVSGSSLINHLPAVRGRYRAGADLSKSNWFQVGGKAEVLFKPEDVTDLAAFLQQKPAEVPVTILGVGSNLIIREGGIQGVVIKLGRGFTQCEVNGLQMRVGAACMDVHVAEIAAAAGLSGLEFLSGIPGTIGGALRMNGGAYGSDMAAIVVEAEAIDPAGRVHRLSHAEMGFTYRHCSIPEGWIFTGCILQAQAGDVQEIQQRMQEIRQAREASQPVRSRTGGSTFKNPQGHKAWQLIDAAGCRGLRHGDAQVSELHCNFLINHGEASAADLEALGEEVRQRVHALSGIWLEWEIKRIGDSNTTASA
jgi:UDP-N-acetylmuramate dehydrogenase